MAKENEEMQPVEVAVVEAEATPAATVEPTEQPAEKAPKSARDTFREKIGYTPGEEDDDEAEFSTANEMMAALEEKGKKYDDLAEKLLKCFSEEPEDSEVIVRWLDGMPLVSAIVAVKGREALQEPAEGDDGYEDFMKVRDEKKANRDKNNALVEEIRKNAEETANAFDKFCAENGLEGDTKDEVWNEMFGDLENISKGKFTPEIMGRYLKARNHDADVAAAMEQGKADGRNEKIEAERKRMQGSGLPNAVGGARADEEVDAPHNGTADWLSKMTKRR